MNENNGDTVYVFACCLYIDRDISRVVWYDDDDDDDAVVVRDETLARWQDSVRGRGRVWKE